MDYKNDNVWLMQGDCLERMKEIPDGSVDMVLTDPPYKLASGGRKGTILPTKNTPFSKSGECFKNKTPNFAKWIPEIYRVLKTSSYAFIMTNDRNLKEIWNLCEKNNFIFCEILVIRKNTAVPSCYFFKSCEFVLMFRKGKYKKLEKFGTKTVFDVNMPRGIDKLHPTEKPTGFIEKILIDTTKSGGLIFDPFMGSGTTGVACVKTKREFIGIELDEGYFKIAEQRIRDTEPPIF